MNLHTQDHDSGATVRTRAARVAKPAGHPGDNVCLGYTASSNPLRGQSFAELSCCVRTTI